MYSPVEVNEVVMSSREVNLVIEHICIGFSAIVTNKNYADSHQQIWPFGTKWGRGILIKGPNYFEAYTDSYVISHSFLKESLEDNEQTAGAFYFGYNYENKTLYLEYASDRNFDFYEEKVINAIMESLQAENGPLKNFKIKKRDNK